MDWFVWIETALGELGEIGADPTADTADEGIRWAESRPEGPGVATSGLKRRFEGIPVSGDLPDCTQGFGEQAGEVVSISLKGDLATSTGAPLAGP